ncbi:hypothetical protein MBLNU13_g11606t2 [Cladosporium sp. NU13]
MSVTKKKAKVKFKFVNYTNPTDAQESKVRTQVRSQASRWQHSQSRARLHHAALAPDHDVDASACEKSEHSSNASESNMLIDRADSSSSPDLAERREAVYEQDDYFRQDADETDTETTLFTPEAFRLASGGMVKSFSQGVMAFRTIALQDSHNIIGMSLKDMRLELSSVMGLYKNICEIQAIDFARQYDIGGDQETWGRFYAFVYTDPILLSTAVLLGVRNQLDVLGRGIDGQTFASVLQIERFLMRSINEALGDPIRGISDPMLIAVALCAAYEIKHGTGACYHIHMRGLVQMIQLRGGLLAIGALDPYVVRLLAWIDTNTSKIAGCRPYLQGMVNGLASRPNANTAIFRARGEVT